MKTLKVLSLALLAMVFVLGSACKYEEGPAVSLRTKTARLTGTWKVEKWISKNGTESKPDANDNSTWTLDKDNNVVLKVTIFGQTGEVKGDWEWINSKEGVRVTLDYDGFKSTEDYKILRLKNDELWIQDDDGEQTHLIPA